MVEYSEPAPAKINLALHVRRRRSDGYHELETLFAFCIDGDKLHASKTDDLTLAVEGPFAAALDGDNLVLTAARRLKDEAGIAEGAALRLEKKLPVASGLGGGSADAAAALRLLTRLWGCDPAIAARIAPDLGADVPACLLSMTARGEGVGDALTPVAMPDLSDRPVLLVNPLVALSTPEVFSQWDGKDRGALDDWRGGRNDLAGPAQGIAPQISEVLDFLDACEGVDVARMSGSGATCFALFDDEHARDSAGAAVPDKWWHLTSNLR